MAHRIAVFGVPTSAGAHMPGQEKAPAALRQAGVVESLRNACADVADLGDLPVVRHAPDKANRSHQNWRQVLEVAKAVSERVEATIDEGTKLLVLGGDCTISLGVISGFQRRNETPGLIYFDAQTDLNTPVSSSSGAMDSMGMAHMLGEFGAVDEIARMGPRYPMLDTEQVVFYSYVPEELNPAEREAFERRRPVAFTAADVSADAGKTAAAALRLMESRSSRFLVHFDVDALDFVDAPLANIPTINRGISLDDALASLRVLCASPKFSGLIITEINPNHGDEGGRLLRRFVQGIAEALH